jgi:hypothetical protein
MKGDFLLELTPDYELLYDTPWRSTCKLHKYVYIKTKSTREISLRDTKRARPGCTPLVIWVSFKINFMQLRMDGIKNTAFAF